MAKHSHYEINIINRFNSLLNLFLPIAIIGAVGSAALIYTSTSNMFLSLNYFVAGVICLLLVVMRKFLNPFVKVYILIGLSLEISSTTLIQTPYTTSGMLILAISTLMVMGLLSRKLGLIHIFATTGLLFYIFFDHIVSNTPQQLTILNHALADSIEWSIYIIAYIVYASLLYFVIFSIKSDLITSLIAEEQSKETIKSLAYRDSLTQLPNIWGVEDILCKNQNFNGYIVLIHVKDMNLINSIYGSEIGDLVILKSCYYLKKLSSDNDVIGRIEGSDFLWFMRDNDLSASKDKLHDFLVLAKAPDNHFNLDIHIKYSVGIVKTDCQDEKIGHFISKAYLALEETKGSCSQNVILYDQWIEDKIISKEKLKEQLDTAILNESFEIYYQEKVDCRSNTVVGVEALARWFPSKTESIPPSTFVPLIDEILHSVAFGEIIIKKTIADLPVLIRKYGNSIKVSINISPIHLAHESFIPFIKNFIMNSGVNPQQIMFEITEDSIIKDVTDIYDILSVIHSMGFSISIDDFGTGYSSLSYLSHLAIDELKIDQSFIREIFNDPKNIKLVQAIISLKTIYNINVIAEGVETEAQADTLKSMNCFIHQGYLYSKPKSISE